LKEERYDELVSEAIKQDEAGADVLDVNVGLPGIDEPETMKHVVKLLQEVITLPLQIDSSNARAIELACRYYNGKPLINSVNGKDEVME
ncbi:dihydropteroate synthase, partial [Acidaminococcus intestini]